MTPPLSSALERPLDLLNTPIDTGVSIVEASAGSGKTFALSFLYLRLYLEKKLPLDKIHAITFTNLAADELYDRILTLFKVLKTCLLDGDTVASPSSEQLLLQAWLNKTFKPSDYGELNRQVRLVFSSIGQIKINSIHSFYLNFLTEFFIQSGFDHQALLLDEAWRKKNYREATQSYWLSEVDEQLSSAGSESRRRVFLFLFKSPKHLNNIIPEEQGDRLTAKDIPEPDWEEIGSVLAQKKVRTEIYKIAKTESTFYFLNCFIKKLNEQSVRLLNSGRFSYNLIINETIKAIKHPQFRRSMRAQVDALLIDEFQDTDYLQWQIIDRLFLSSSSLKKQPVLYLIGDPKQSIYRFRSADINCYFDALKKANFRYGLTTNWRSDERYINALQALYDMDHFENGPFAHSELPYVPTTVPDHKKNRITLWCHDQSQPTASFILRSPKQHTNEYSVNEGMTFVDQWIKQDCLQFIKLIREKALKQGDHLATARPISPSDLLILLPTNDLVNHVAEMLAKEGIETNKECEELIWKRRASQIVSSHLQLFTNDYQHLSQTDQFRTLSALWGNQNLNASDDLQREKMVSLVNEYKQTLAKRGPYALWQSCLSHNIVGDFGYQKNSEHRQFIAQIDALFAQLQNWWGDGQKSPEELLNCISLQQDKKQAKNDQNDAIRLLTIHKAKGMEATIVMCPYLWKDSAMPSFADHVVYNPKAQQYQLHPKEDSAKSQQEKNRTLYVALTRAKSLLLLYWTPVKHTVTRRSSALQRLLFGEEIINQKSEQIRCDVYEAKIKNLQTMKHVDVLLDDQLIYLESTVNPKTLPPQLTDTHLNSEAVASTPPLRLSFPIRSSGIWSITRLIKLSKQTEEPTQTVTDISQPTSDEQTEDQTHNHHYPFISATALGTMVHNILRAAIEAPTTSIKSLIDETVSDFLSNIKQKNSFIDHIQQLVFSTLSATFPSPTTDAPLNLLKASQSTQLDRSIQLFSEVPFDFFIERWQIEKLNALADQHPKALLTPLSDCVIENNLFRGYIDLIFIEQDTIWIIDYKTNFLGETAAHYENASIARAIKTQHYGWQSLFYCYAVNRWLRSISHQHFNIRMVFLFSRGLSLSQGKQGFFEMPMNQNIIADLENLLA